VGETAARISLIDSALGRQYGVLISTDGGFDPVWAQNGKELFYRNGDSMVAVDVALRPSFTAGKPRKLWQGPYSHGLSSLCGAPGPSSSNYDVTPDGAKFLMIKEDEWGARIAQIHVALNWAEELKRLTESKRIETRQKKSWVDSGSGSLPSE